MTLHLPRRINLRYRHYARQLTPLVQNKEVRTYTEIGFTLIALLAFGWFAIRPTLLTIMTLRKEHAVIQAVVASFDDKIAALSEAQNLLTQYKPERQIVRAAIPDNPDVGRTIRVLEGIATKHRVTIDNLHVESVVYPLAQSVEGRQRNIAELEYSLTLVGANRALLDFAQDLHAAQRLFLISSFTLSESSMQLLVRAPYMKQAETPEGIGKAAQEPVGEEQILEK